jgi:hypothetical protein
MTMSDAMRTREERTTTFHEQAVHTVTSLAGEKAALELLLKATQTQLNRLRAALIVPVETLQAHGTPGTVIGWRCKCCNHDWKISAEESHSSSCEMVSTSGKLAAPAPVPSPYAWLTALMDRWAIHLDGTAKRLEGPDGVRDFFFRYTWEAKDRHKTTRGTLPDVQCVWEGFETAEACLQDLRRTLGSVPNPLDEDLDEP